MPSRIQQNGRPPRQRQPDMVDDERDWAGQRAQRPANDEEKNYRPPGGKSNPNSPNYD